MKKVIALLTAVVFILALAGCAAGNNAGQTEAETKAVETKAAQTTKTEAATTASEAPAATDETKTVSSDTESSGKTLVVYFSATGTTKGVAEQIAGIANADIYEITAAQPYSADDLNWNDSNSRTTIEQNDKTVRPVIGSEQANLDGYDTIFIGYPIWWGEEPRIMDTFVESYDFTGKTMIPFCTSGGSGIGASGDNLKANAGTGNWLEGERLSSSSDIEGWIKGLNL